MKHHFPHAFRTLCVALVVCLGLFGGAGVRAQEESAATITGQVTDATSAVVPNASVVVVNTQTNTERRVTTNEEGNYTISPLQPGTYTVTVELAGFKKFVQTDLVLNARDRRPVNIVLEAGNIGEVVTVTSEQTGVLDSPTGQALVSGEQIVELPLNNRNFIRLLEAGVPGVSSDLEDETGFGLTSRANISINGMRRNSVSYFVDGVSNTDVGSNITLLSAPTVDSIQEFKVLSSNYTAEIGRSGGGAVSIVTRGGGNEFHGTLYEFVRNDRFNANSFFNNRLGRRADGSLVADVPKLRYNNFGGTISGPVHIPRFGEGGRASFSGKDRTFFFFSEEVRRVIRGQADAGGTVPSLAQRGLGTPGGNFDYSSTLGALLYRTPAGAFVTTAAGNTPVFVTDTAGNTVQARNGMIFRPSDNRAYFNNIIPRTDVDPRSIALLNAFPLPNTPGSLNGFTGSRIDVLNTRQETLRIDHNFNDNHRIFGRYTHDLSETIEPQGLFFTAGFPGIPTSETRVPGQVFAASLTSVITPQFVNEASYNFSSNLIASTIIGRARRSDYPGSEAIREIFPENNQNIIPRINTRFTLLGASQGYNIAYKNHVFRDVATWTRGNHTFKFGGEISFEKKGENGSNNTQGTFDFSAVQTQGLVGTAGITGTGDSFASFLLGRANAYTEAERDVIIDFSFGRREVFAQDTWKVRPNVTLDYGVRYQYFLPPTEQDNILATFDPFLFSRSQVQCTSAACTAFVAPTPTNGLNRLNGISIAGSTSPFGRKIFPSDKNNFSPRVGIAYSPRFESGLGRFLFGGENKSVIRAGYGLYYDQPLVGIFESAALGTRPFTDSSSFTSTLTSVITFSTPDAGVPPGTLAPSGAITAIARDFQTPEYQQYSVGIQRELFRNAVIDISYVGTKGDHLIRRRNINFQLPSEIVRVGTANAGSVRPFLGYGVINYQETSAKSRYNGLLTAFNYRFGNGFTITTAYTFSKNLTDSTNDRDAIDDPQNAFDVRSEYAEARTSRPHIFSASYVYELPYFRNSSSTFKRLLLSGYQISGITNIESGAPVPRVTLDTLSGQRGAYPNLTGDPQGGLAGTIDPNTGLPFMFDPTVFAAPPNGTFGNAGRSFARFPGKNQTNLSVVKNLYFNSERNRYLQLRAEGFNIFNHTQFNDVLATGRTFSTVGDILKQTTFGRPSGTRPPREFQFAAKFYF
ncbi:MAG TPA: carboxypeptidase regulatory-like domain-containing protein [Pyrinomonadaceae bacterium]|nr:carboxypeptidase regulatory-like domain-containing protein [Pyrinomonadaceae bacterium]